MRARTIWITALLPALAWAQSEDWGTFPAEPPPPPPTEQPAPQKPAETKAAPPAARTPDAPSGGELKVVSTEERVLPGTEQHSPSTIRFPWNARQNRRLIPGPEGAVGFVHTSSAALGPPGILRIGTHGDYFTGEFPIQGASHVRTAGNFVASYQPLAWLEAYVGYGAAANTNDHASPALIQAMGDVTFGLKFSHHWGGGFHAGADLRGLSYSGVGNQDVRNFAFGFAPRAVMTWDVRHVAPSVPILVHLNAGVQLDGTGELITREGDPLRVHEEYALGINQYDRFLGRAALEFPIAIVAPYVEYSVGVPLGVENGEVVAPDETMVSITEVMPQTVGGGLRITAVKDLTFTVGADIGLARTVGYGIPATPPWTVFFGAAFNADPFQRGESKIVETVRERPGVIKQAQVEGIVLDAQTQKPLPGAIVAVVGANVPPVASDASEGRFLTHDVPPGPVTLRVEKAGYREVAQEVVLETGKTVAVQVALEPMAKLAHLLFSVTGGANKTPIPAEVRVQGPIEKTAQLSPGDGSKLDVPPGQYVVSVLAPEHLAQTREVQISENAEMRLAFELEPEPKKKLVVVKADKIEILQQVHFATGRSTIMRDSFSLLNQVVDAIVKNDIKRIRIEGHTDNRGGKKRNQTLSEARARAVAEYLANQGIDAGRIETAGFGDSKPVAPNLTARGRELNRRVEFLILAR